MPNSAERSSAEFSQILSHCLYKGSVKDVYGFEGRDPLVFSFSDRYSIFDWGEMPDALPEKGESISVMGDLFFRYLADPANWLKWTISETYPKFWRDSLLTSATWSTLKRTGLFHHCLGLVNELGSELVVGQKSKYLAVKSISRIRPIESRVEGKIVYDYSAYKNGNYLGLVPLEVVFRFGATEGSSFLKRMDSIPDYLKSLGFVDRPELGEWFDFPVVEFFTKLEPTDRYLSQAEAREIAGMSQEEMDRLVSLTLFIALRLKDLFSSIDVELWDGKFEFSFAPGIGSASREFQLVDSIGPDELRLLGRDGVHLSKEFLRRVYRNSPWYHACEKAKDLGIERGTKDWKKICVEELKQIPAPLPQEAFELAKSLYPSLAESLAKAMFQKSVYPESVPLTAICKRIKEYK